MNNCLEESSWFHKYSPKKVKELVLHKNAVLKIIRWIGDFVLQKQKIKNKVKPPKTSTFKSSLLISGSHGIGKTTIVRMILEELGYDILSITTNTKNSIKKKKKKKVKKKNEDLFNNLVTNNDVLSLIKNQKKKYVLLIDDIDSITSSQNKQKILTILKKNEEKLNFPIIFISNKKHNKLITTIEKKSYVIIFYPPNYTDMKHILLKIVNHENINISGISSEKEEIIKTIIDYSQNDIRQLICNLKELKNVFGSDKLIYEDLLEYLKSSKKKDIDYDLYESTSNLLYSYSSIDECQKMYETEKTLLPLMIHQYYPKYLYHNVASIDKKFLLSTKISKLLSQGDVVDNYIYGDQNWDLQEEHGLLTCVIPSFYLNSNKKEYVYKVRMSFPDDLNKTSIQRINRKNIIKVQPCFKNIKAEDSIMISQIIKTLIKKNKINDCIKILKHYNIQREHIDSLLKIDKMDESVPITSKQKKNLISLLSNS